MQGWKCVPACVSAYPQPHPVLCLWLACCLKPTWRKFLSPNHTHVLLWFYLLPLDFSLLFLWLSAPGWLEAVKSSGCNKHQVLGCYVNPLAWPFAVQPVWQPFLHEEEAADSWQGAGTGLSSPLLLVQVWHSNSSSWWDYTHPARSGSFGCVQWRLIVT